VRIARNSFAYHWWGWNAVVSSSGVLGVHEGISLSGKLKNIELKIIFPAGQIKILIHSLFKLKVF
jgi:hypothetical protein